MWSATIVYCTASVHLIRAKRTKKNRFYLPIGMEATFFRVFLNADVRSKSKEKKTTTNPPKMIEEKTKQKWNEMKWEKQFEREKKKNYDSNRIIHIDSKNNHFEWVCVCVTLCKIWIVFVNLVLCIFHFTRPRASEYQNKSTNSVFFFFFIFCSKITLKSQHCKSFGYRLNDHFDLTRAVIKLI